MGIIDEKGRLFGKINVVDLLVVVLVLAAIGGGLYKYVFMKEVQTTINTAGAHKALITIYDKDLEPGIAECIQVGDVVSEMRSNAKFGVVKSVTISPMKKPANASQGAWVASEYPGMEMVTFTVETLEPWSEDLMLGSKAAKAGTTIEVKGPKFQLETTITGVELVE